MDCLRPGPLRPGAADLGWKLAAAITGWAGPELLDSYETERRPMAQRAIAEAERNMKVLPLISSNSSSMTTDPPASERAQTRPPQCDGPRPPR
ncbi:hypothetical protein DLJ46_18375 [Micromonospora globispora]|uniref:FAD-binding domain-containing protein n=1 Tax=Micromonospora globispora TaxID=1450148 RepID=A0A317K084_9ACTN|nr:hypothetical protein DLJ46_18375 [Micromonospora globispora]